jgi:hypothetical protein
MRPLKALLQYAVGNLDRNRLGGEARAVLHDLYAQVQRVGQDALPFGFQRLQLRVAPIRAI